MIMFLAVTWSACRRNNIKLNIEAATQPLWNIAVLSDYREIPTQHESHILTEIFLIIVCLKDEIPGSETKSQSYLIRSQNINF